MKCTAYEWATFLFKLTFCFINTSGYINLKLRFKDPGRLNCHHCYAPFTCVQPKNIPVNERSACCEKRVGLLLIVTRLLDVLIRNYHVTKTDINPLFACLRDMKRAFRLMKEDNNDMLLCQRFYRENKVH